MQRTAVNNRETRIIQSEQKAWLNVISITLMLTLDGLSKGSNLFVYFVICDLKIPR